MLAQIVDFLFPPQCGGCGKIGSGACKVCLPADGRIAVDLPTLRVTALGPYEGKIRRVVLALKSGRRDVAEALAARLARDVNSHAVLVPIPTTAARRRERGFDACELMAQRISELGGARALTGLVQISGDRQKGRNRDQRLAARGRFAWRGCSLAGLRVTLVDDVVTTGATLEDCAAVVRAQGASVDRAIVVAGA